VDGKFLVAMIDRSDLIHFIQSQSELHSSAKAA
jgi:hypothetical protein